MDNVILAVDRALRTLTGQRNASRPSPASDLLAADLTPDQARHAAGLMRVNHCGEICAQALYDGQAATARDPTVRAVLEAAGAEEVDHLAWCAARLAQLQARPSVLDPLFYVASFGIGAVTGLLGDRVSLGFVEATEDQVVRHLDRHLDELPAEDVASRAVLTQMRADEARHGAEAVAAGGAVMGTLGKAAMGLIARVMTFTTYRI